jgi:hypothetical protein
LLTLYSNVRTDSEISVPDVANADAIRSDHDQTRVMRIQVSAIVILESKA